jgi:hypothetical protein
VIIGNGERCFFWTDKWINGGSIEEIAPEVFQSTPLAIRARRTVAQALNNGNWIDDIRKPITINYFMQLLRIWEETNTVILVPEEEDRWIWSWEANSRFTTSSVDQAHFKGKNHL